MRFSVSPSVFELLPDLRVGTIALKGIANTESHSEVEALLRGAEAQLRSRHTDESFKDDPHILSFMEAHRSFGNNPKRYYPSHFALAKRVLKGGSLPSINSLVDLYNVISLRHLLPVGGEDTDHCMGEIELCRAIGNEPFVELGGTQNDPPEAGELIYKDSEGVLCRKMNWRESDRTKLTQATLNAVLVIESLSPSDPLEDLLTELESLVTKYCRGDAIHAILSTDHPSMEL